MSDEKGFQGVAAIVPEGTEVDTAGGPIHSQEQLAGAAEAVRKAIEEAGGDESSPEEQALDEDAAALAQAERNGDIQKKEKDQAGEEPGEDSTIKSRLSRLVKEREKGNRIRRDAEASANKVREEANQLKSQYEQQLAQLRKDAEYLQQLRDNPMDALRAAGKDPEEFFTDIATANTPEGQMRKTVFQLQRELEAERSLRQNREQQEKLQREQWERQQVENQKKGIIDGYLKEARDAEKYPTISKVFGFSERILVEAGHEAANLFREATGKQATYDQVCEFLEEQASLSLSADSKAKSANGKSGLGGKTLPKSQPGQTGERRSFKAEPTEKDSWEERERKAKLAIRSVLKDAGDR